ncbi:helix-turn-helix transcriptional regulator [Paenibacillus sp. GCM10023252]|uniref:helix-turn-helix transcriptional regulator n=1 Tax=Paenibacillus sp. GCM10023252 TaxID=3252649 RepID=UPI00361EC868
MARESFDKEIQFIRMLALTSGAYTRQQFAERMGVSVHTYDKTIRRLKDMVQASGIRRTDNSSDELTELLRYNHYEGSDPSLLFLYRAKSLKESESFRLSALVKLLADRELTAIELINACCDGYPAEFPLPDEKTVRQDLKYLEEVGVILRLPGGRPHRYRLRAELTTQLSDEELIDLYDFVDVMSNTQVPSVQGYLLRDNLKEAMRRHSALTDVPLDTHIYRYHYPSRILDEAHLYQLLSAIQERRRLSYVYYSPKSGRSYASRNTNPKYESSHQVSREVMLPVKVIYDHQYGRWYLVGHHHRQGLIVCRLDGITQLEEENVVPEEEFLAKSAAIAERLRYSWLVDTARPVLVRARFYNPGPGEPNFVLERVQLQGQWGEITEMNEQSFIYEITVNGITDIKPWLRSFGSSCEVLEPERLRQDFIREWKEILAYYEPVREDI